MTQDTCHDREATAELDALRRRVAELESAAADFQRDLAEYGEQAERYRIISELISDYVYAMDVHEDGSVAPEWHTKGMARMTGFQMDELNAKMASLQIIHPADRATVAAQLQDCLAGQPTVIEIRIVTEDEGTRWLRHYVHPVWDESQGRVVRFYGAAQDITERRITRAALEEHQTALNKAQELARMASFVWDVRDKAVTWSEKMYSLLGIDRNELTEDIVDTYIQLVHPEDRERVHRQITEMIETRESHRIEFRVIRPNGEERILQSDSDYVLDEDGLVAKAIGLHWDVTEQRLAEQALRSSEARLRLMVENLPAGAVYVENDGIWINRKVEEIVGYSREELPTLDAWFRHLYGSEASRIRRIYETDRAAGFPEPREVTLERKNGESRLVQFIVYAFEGGEVWLLTDITDQRRMEQALRDSEERYRRMVETASEGIWTVDDRYCTTFVNQKMADMLGYTTEEMLGRPVNHFMATEDMPAFGARSMQRKSGASGVYEYRGTRKNGSTVWMLVSIAPIKDSEDRFAGAVAMVTNITDRKRLLEEQQRADKLEAVGTLAGGIAHDFNNILTGILGNLSLAQCYLDEGRDIDDLLVEGQRATVRAKDLTQQLLTFARGGAPIKQVAEVADMVAEVTEFALRGSNVLPSFDIAGDLWPAEVDTGQMSQVIHNLVVNANQAMPAGGELYVSVDNAHVPAYTALPLLPGNYIRIVVRDVGTGIAPAHLPRIFDPYFTTKQSGSGLGLATVYSIVTAHGGHIATESELGVGTTFTIYLPASIQEPDTPRKPSTPVRDSRQARQAKILLMDDDLMVRQIGGRVLRHLGHTCEFATDGEEAIRMHQAAVAAGAPFDLVIMDLTIPGGMGGKEAIEELRRITPDVKAIVSSGYANDPIMADFTAHGFCGVVAKPWDIRELGDTITRVMDTSC